MNNDTFLAVCVVLPQKHNFFFTYTLPWFQQHFNFISIYLTLALLQQEGGDFQPITELSSVRWRFSANYRALVSEVAIFNQSQRANVGPCANASSSDLQCHFRKKLSFLPKFINIWIVFCDCVEYIDWTHGLNLLKVVLRHLWLILRKFPDCVVTPMASRWRGRRGGSQNCRTWRK